MDNHEFLVDTIVAKRSEIMLSAPCRVTTLKLYGSVLARRETPNSDIDFLGMFDQSIPYEWYAAYELEEKLEAFFNRRVNIVDSRRIPELFHPSIDTDPVDIMELEAGKQYTITPKSSKLYFIMLDKLFSRYCSTRSNQLGNSNSFDLPMNQIKYRATFISFLASEISWWFSRLLRLEDNDLKDYPGFYFVEVLYLCDKLFDHYEQKSEDVACLKEVLPAIKKYVAARLPMYE